jgi:hypothetical protein
MPKPNTSKFVTLADGTLTLGQPGNYTLDFTGNTVVVSRGSGTTFTDAQFATINSVDLGHANKVNLTGISFVDAEHAANHKFEPDSNLDGFLAGMIASYGVQGTIDRLTVDGGKAGLFQLIWDYVDDNYSYYNTGINAVAVELGLAYADYLRDGGSPLTGVVAKFTPDGADAGSAPDRLQSLHDNLLGNLDINSIIDKFFDGNSANGAPDTPAGYFTGGSNATPDEATGQQLLDAVFDAGLDGRPYYGGYETETYQPTHAWDVMHHLLIA